MLIHPSKKLRSEERGRPITGKSDALRLCHSRACLARVESPSSEGELRWCVEGVGEGRPVCENGADAGSRARGSHARGNDTIERGGHGTTARLRQKRQDLFPICRAAASPLTPADRDRRFSPSETLPLLSSRAELAFFRERRRGINAERFLFSARFQAHRFALIPP